MICIERLGLGSLKVVNDFAATAMAPDADVFPVGPRTPEAAGPIGIMGPGTRLGVSALIPDGRKWVIVAGEGGHVTLPSAPWVIRWLRDSRQVARE